MCVLGVGGGGLEGEGWGRQCRGDSTVQNFFQTNDESNR